MTTTQLVIIDNGTETDWIDPIIELAETDTHWYADNGYCRYEITKKPGRVVEQRPLESQP